MRATSGFLIACLCGQVACGGGRETNPPANLSYSTNPATYTVGIAITPNLPASTGGAVTAYSVDPPLPAGLRLDAASGVISGTPGHVWELASHTVTATNEAGSTTVALSILVNPAPTLPPSNLVYSTNPAVYWVNVAIAPNPPSSTGGPVDSYEVEPELPAMFVLNRTTGELSGWSSVVLATSYFTVTAVNTGGSTTAVLSITVEQEPTVPPGNLAYSTNPATYVVGEAITPNTPSSTGGAVVGYVVSPALPVGLSLNPWSGVITGTPTTPATAANYTVTGGNAGGHTSALLNITVIRSP